MELIGARACVEVFYSVLRRAGQIIATRGALQPRGRAMKLLGCEP